MAADADPRVLQRPRIDAAFHPLGIVSKLLLQVACDLLALADG
jgi:hypothetical protein